MRVFDYDFIDKTPAPLGLIALQTDERIEQDFRRLIPLDAPLFVSRVPSGLDVSPETLQSMDAAIPQAAALLPQAQRFAAVGYGCTSGTAQIGVERVAAQVQSGAPANAVTNPLSALIACCKGLNIKRLALLSPYVESVSERLRDRLGEAGIATPVFGTFAEAEEARVVRIAPASLSEAGHALAHEAEVDALFLSCTNLDTLDVIAPLSARLNMPVLSSNQVLAWHMCHLAGVTPAGHPAFSALLPEHLAFA